VAIKQFPKEIQNYKGEWVALSLDESRVVGHGKTPEEATNEAKRAGEENATLIYVPIEWPQMMVV
jgi:hypothetical protein